MALALAFEAILVAVLVLVKQNSDEVDANRRTQLILDKTYETEGDLKTVQVSVNQLLETVAELQAAIEAKKSP